MRHLSIGNQWNADLVEHQHALWSKDPASVDPEWRAFFEGFELGQTTPPTRKGAAAPAGGGATAAAQAAIHAFRAYGHLQANTNPLAPTPR